MERIFCACAPGLEPTLARELAGLGLSARAAPGGAEAQGEDAAAWACLGARVADSALVRLWEGDERGLPAAKAEARRRLPGVELQVRAHGRESSVSADAAGSPLYKRGWRARVTAAPLRESLAAGILLAAGYSGDEPFLDPMCGSGTLAIEAALVAMRRAPGHGRLFAFERWPGARPERVAAIRAELASRERAAPFPIHASDRNMGALRTAQKNAAAAGVAPAIRFERADAARASVPAGAGLCATNPPWGVRLDEEVEAAWRALGVLCARLPGWRLFALAPGRAGPERLLGRPPASVLALRNGGLPVRLLGYRLYPAAAAG